MYSKTEEDYLKAIYHFSGQQQEKVGTSMLAEYLSNKPASVTDMLRRLSEKELIHYKKSHGVTLTDKGVRVVLQIVRKHRIWETFLVEKLKFGWEEVHEIADELEHVRSELLIHKMDAFLGYPKFDPHGDPIPTAEGDMPEASTLPLSEIKASQQVSFVSVATDQADFLQYLDKMELQIGDIFLVQEREAFDGSLRVLSRDKEVYISHKVAENILVKVL
jgi:DtxR family transcriptional regulator, Mn-dependent transcriptional regulator